jgi:hypothetical protein
MLHSRFSPTQAPERLNGIQYIVGFLMKTVELTEQAP